MIVTQYTIPSNVSPGTGMTVGLTGAERSSELNDAILALDVPTHKRHFARGRVHS